MKHFSMLEHLGLPVVDVGVAENVRPSHEGLGLRLQGLGHHVFKHHFFKNVHLL